MFFDIPYNRADDGRNRPGVNQPFGRFEGTLRDGDQVGELQNVSGFTEEHYAKW